MNAQEFELLISLVRDMSSDAQHLFLAWLVMDKLLPFVAILTLLMVVYLVIHKVFVAGPQIMLNDLARGLGVYPPYTRDDHRLALNKLSKFHAQAAAFDAERDEWRRQAHELKNEIVALRKERDDARGQVQELRSGVSDAPAR